MVVATRALIFKDNKILLVSKDRDKWVTPGGMVDSKELLVDALKRELKEELGLTLTESHLTYVSEFKDKKFNNVKLELHYVCKVSGDIKIGNDPDCMVNHYQYFTKEELKNIKAFPQFIQSIDFTFKQNIHMGIFNN